MTAPLSQDLRRQLVRAVEAGASAREAAARFEVSASAAIKLVQRFRETGSTAPAKIGGYRKPLLAGQADLLCELTATEHGITLAEIRDALMSTARAAMGWVELPRGGFLHPR
jgi:transposase